MGRVQAGGKADLAAAVSKVSPVAPKGLDIDAKKLGRDFYARATVDVARELLGKVLVRKQGRSLMAGRIVETEAYVGTADLACHASKGRTRRTEVMFGPPGYAYVYLVYGMHCCLNVVTEAEGFPAAVLIRAIEPLSGLARMRRNRGGNVPDRDIGSGPGKLCQALGVDRVLNGASLAGRALWLEEGNLLPAAVLSSPRIGVSYAGPWQHRLWRFFIEGSPYVSRHRINASAIRKG